VTVRKFRIQIDGQWFDVQAEEVFDDGPRAVAKPVGPSTPNQAAATSQVASEGASILAPLPGTILDVKVLVGQTVSSGEIVIILEAMKMENEIISTTSGEVKQILVEKGQSVAAGDALLTLV